MGHNFRPPVSGGPSVSFRQYTTPSVAAEPRTRGALVSSRSARALRLFILGTLLFAFVLAASPHLSEGATIRFVDDSYSADNAGLNQWTTIQRAINNASNGDTIYIYSGTYAESVTVNKTLNIVGDSRNSTVIDPPLGNGLNILSNNVNLSSFTVTGATYGVQISSPVSNLNIDSLTFEANTRGVFVNLANNVTVSACYFGNQSGYLNAGIYASRGANLTAMNNTFIGNYYGAYLDRTTTAIVRDGNVSLSHYGIFLTNTLATVVDRNHVGNSSANGYGVYLDSDHNSTVTSNRIDNMSGSGVQIYYSVSETLSSNDVWNCSSDYAVQPASDTSGTYYGHNVASSDLAEGKAVYYYTNTTGITVPSGAGWIFASNVTNLSIPAENISHAGYAVELIRVNNLALAGLTASTTPGVFYYVYAVWAYSTTNLTLTGVNFTGYGTAVYVQNSANVTLQNSSTAGPSGLPPYYFAYGFQFQSVAGARVLNNTGQHAVGGNLYSSDYALIQNNTLNDSYGGYSFYSSKYGRASLNVITNSTGPLSVGGSTLADFQWTITADNYWEGRLLRSYLNASGFAVATNLSWVLLTNVTNVTSAYLAAANSSNYASEVAFSFNVTFSNVVFNGSNWGLYITQSQRVTVLQSTTNNSAYQFQVDTSSEIVLINGTWLNITYESLGLYSMGSLSVVNVTSTCVIGCQYFSEVYTASGLFFDNITVTGIYQFGYFETTTGSTFNRINATGAPGGSQAAYFYNGSDLNFTNSTYGNFSYGFYLDGSTWNTLLRNATFSGLGYWGLQVRDVSSGNLTITSSRFTGAAGNADKAVQVEGLQSRLLLQGNNITGFSYGFFLDPMVNVTVSGNQINNTTEGIWLSFVDNSTVTGNTLRDIFDQAIHLDTCTNVTVSTNSITNAQSSAINLLNSINLTVSGNNIQGGNDGIHLSGGRGALVASNIVNGTANNGIYVNSGHLSSTFNGNTVTNGLNGFYIEYVSYLTLDSNALSGNTYNFHLEAYSIEQFYHRVNTTNTVNGKPVYYLVNASGGTVPTGAGLAILANTTNYLVSGVTIDHEWHGIRLFQCTGINVINVAISSSFYGLLAEYAVNSTLTDSRVNGGEYGSQFWYGTNLTAVRDVMNGSLYSGMQVYYSRSITVDNSSFNNTGNGLYLSGTDVSNITNSRFTNGSYIGLTLDWSSGDVVWNNSFLSNWGSVQISGYYLSHFNHTIPANNTIEGRPIFYRINATNVSAPASSAMVIFANVTSGTASGLTISEAGDGVLLFGSRFVNVSSITFDTGYYGVHAIQSQNVTMRNLTLNVTTCCVYDLVYSDSSANLSLLDSVIPRAYTIFSAYYSTNVTIRNLTAGDLTNYTSTGSVLVASGYNDGFVVENNTLSYTSYSVQLYGYDPSSTVSNVTVSNNTYGPYSYATIYIGSSYVQNVTAYHNNFNLSYGGGYGAPYDSYDVVTWFRAYPWGGNWWSTWTSPDIKSGALQATAGGDGIVDNPYAATPTRNDPYPLVDPWPPRVRLESPANQSAVRPGAVLQFNVSLYFDTVKYSIDNASAVAFAAPFQINTTGWSEGAHVIWVNATDLTPAGDSEFFVIAIDTTGPTFSGMLANGTYAAGTELPFFVNDLHVAFNATWNNGNGTMSVWNQSGAWFNLTTASWPDGDYTVFVTAWDTAGNSANVTRSYGIDGNPPVVSLLTPSNNSVIRAGTTLDFNIVDAHFQNASWLKGLVWTSLSAPFDVDSTGFADGPTDITVVGIDVLGRRTARVFTFTFDSTLPTITLNTPANNSVVAAGTTVDLSVSDTNFQNASWTTGSTWNAIAAPFDISTAGFADGLTTVTVRAFDLAGNNRTSTFSFTFDSTAPTVSLASPANNSVIAGGTTLSFAITDANAFTATWNNGSGSNALGAPYNVSTTAWADGSVTVVIVATDTAGNARTRSFNFVMDSTLATITLNSPANNSVIPAGRLIDLSVSDTHLSTVTWNNGSGAVTLGSPFDIPTPGWPDGSTNITLIALDAAGNSRTSVFRFVFDSTPPSVVLSSPANNSVVLPGAVLDFTVTDTNLNNATWNNGSGNNSLTTPFDVSTTAWADNQFSITVTATDLAGNVRSIIVVVSVDSAPPTITLNQPANGTTFGSGTLIDLSVTDLHFTNASWNNGSSPNALSSPFDIDTTGWAAGNITVAVNATDAAGNTASRAFSFTIDNSFPAVILVTPSNNSVIRPGTTLDFSVVDNDLNTTTWSNGSAPATLAAPYDVSTTGWSDGHINVTINATDNSSHTVSVIFHFVIDSTAPVVLLVSPSNNTVISAGVQLSFSFTELNFASARYNIGGGNVTLTAPYKVDSTGWADGEVNITVTAFDLAGNSGAATFHFTVDSTPPAITLGTPSNNSVIAPGTTLDFNVSDAHSFSVTRDNGTGPVALGSPFDVSTAAWTDGGVDVIVVATDVAGNVQSRLFHFTIDGTAPTVSLTAPSNNSVIAAGTTISFSVNDANLAAVTRNNGSGALGLASPYDLATPGWPDGSTNITVIATDQAGNSRTVVVRFIFDSTAPTVTLGAPANNSVIRANTTLDFTVTDANFASATWNNGSGSNALTSPFDVSTANWPDGSTTVTVTATDAAGNSRAVSFQFTLDSTRPTISLNSPANSTVIRAGTALDFAISDANGVAAANWTNGSGPFALASPFDVATAGWADGAFDVTVSAVDPAGNAATQLFHWTLDSTAPTITLVAPANNSVIRPATAIDFTVADANGVASALWNNGSGPNTLPSPFDINTTGWAEGTVTVTVNATDAAGNLRVSTFAFTFDSTPPVISLVSPSNNSVVVAGTTIDLSVTDAHFSGATWNNSSGANALPSPFDINTTGWANGPFNITVTATDLAGNARTDVFRVIIDSTPPNITLTSPANDSVISAGTVLDFTVVEPNLNTSTWNNGSGAVSFSPPFDISTASWADGSVTVTVTAVDLAGNSRSASFHFTMDSTAPIVGLNFPANNSVITPGTDLDFDASDLYLNTVSWNNGSGANALPSPFDVSTVGWPEGPKNVTVTATDRAGNTRAATFHFVFDATPPTISVVTPSNNSIILAGTTIDLTVTDANFQGATWNNGSGANTLASPFDISTSGWADGVYNVTVIATDLAGNVRTVVLRYTFDTTPPTVTLLSPSNNSYIRAGATLDLLVTDLTTLTVTWDNGSGPNALASPFDIVTSGWPDGPTNITVTATDAVSLQRIRVFHFTFDSVLPTVSLLSPSNNSFIRPGVQLNFSISDTNLNTATWDNGGGGTTFATQWNISTVGWADGPINISVDATDLAGNLRSRTFHLTIDSAVPSVTLSSPTNNSYIPSGTLLNLSITDTNLDTATWDDGTGAQSFAAQWTISTTGWAEGPVNITVTADDLASNVKTRIFHFTIDSIFPVLNLLAPSNNSVFEAGVLINFTISDTNLNTATWDDGSGAQPFATNWNISTGGWPDGPRNLTVSAADLASNVKTRFFHFTIDSTLPTLNLNGPTNDTYIVAGTVVNLTISDANLDQTSWEANGAGPQAFATQWEIPTAGWADNSYNITVRASDLAGNVRLRYYRFWVDSTKPIIQLNATTQTNNSYFDQRNFTTVQFDVIEAALSTATWTTGAAPTPLAAPFAINVSAWPDGAYTFTVVATDRAGNSVTRWFSFTLDSVAPVVNAVAWENTYFSNGTVLSGTLFDLNLLWSHAYIDAAAGVNGSAQNYSLSTAGLGESSHTLHVEAFDRAGHLTTRDFAFAIDSLDPVIAVTDPADGAHVPRGTLLNITATDNNAINVTWQRDGGALLAANGTGMPRSVDTTSWPDGRYLVHFIVRDPAGHRVDTNITIVIDSSKPSLPSVSALPLNQTYDEDRDITLDASSASDGPNPLPPGSFLWTFSTRAGPLALDQRTGSMPTYRWADPGDYAYTLAITDLAGNSDARTYSVHIADATPPTVSLLVNATVDEDTSVAFVGDLSRDNDYLFLRNTSNCGGASYDIVDSAGASVNFPLPSSGVGALYPCLDLTHVFANPGLYTVRLTVVDPAGLSNASSVVVRVRDRTAPVLSGVSIAGRANAGDNLTFDASVVSDNDLENVSLITYTWLVKAAGSTVDTLTGSSAHHIFPLPGAFVVNLTARDSSGNAASREFAVYINDVPALQTALPQAMVSGTTYDLDLVVADSDAGDSINISFASTPWAVTQTLTAPRVVHIRWTPTGYGPKDWNLTLSDGWATTTIVTAANVSLPPSATNLPPEIKSTPVQEVLPSVMYTYDVNAEDPSNDVLYYALVVYPAGMSIDRVTGLITWVHGVTSLSPQQTWTVNVSVWDGYNTVYQNYTIRWRPGGNHAPTIDGPQAWASLAVEKDQQIIEHLELHVQDQDDAVSGLLYEVTFVSSSVASARVEKTSAGADLVVAGLQVGNATVRIKVSDASGGNATRDITVRVTAPPGSPAGSEGTIGLLPLLGLAVAAGTAGFFLLVRGRNKKRREGAAAAKAQIVSGVAAPTIAGEAGTVVLTGQAAAAASAAAALAAGPAEKKITYTIEGLFVIYKDGRMLYAKTDMGQAKFEDPELVSSMFTAVTSFIKDSFQSEGELNKMGYGDNQIIIERGRSVFMAAIVYGEPDQEFHDQMKAAIENLELSYAGMIEEWDGMMDHFSDMEVKLVGITSLTAGITRREVQLATTKQEVLMLSELEFFQGFVRLKCGIKNNTPSVITKATVDIEYNEDVLRLARVEPAAYRTAGAKVLLGVLNPGEKSSVAYYFDPQICTESQIDGVCRYRDASGVLYTVAMKTRKAEVVCPLFFTKEHANTAMLKRLVEAELGEKDSKVFEIQKIPPYIKHKDVFDLIKSVVNAHDVQMVREFTKYNPFHGEAWFYGETKVKGYKIVIRATVIEETNAIEFFAASTNMKAITGLLAEFNHTLNSMVIEKYSDLKIAQIFDSQAKAEIEKRTLMSTMSSADLAGGETEQAGEGASGAPLPPAIEPKGDGGAKGDRDTPEPDDEGKGGGGL